VAPSVLCSGEFVNEPLVEEQVAKVGVVIESILNLFALSKKSNWEDKEEKGSGDTAQESGANDATTSPHEGDATIIEFPLVLSGSSAHHCVSLGV
jgi:hypothetical protein